MKSLWKSSLAFGLGLCLTGAHAGEDAWRPAEATGPTIARAGGEAGPAVTLGQPVSLGRPVPLADQPVDALGGTLVNDAALRPIAFTTVDSPPSVYRGVAGVDPGIAKPMPVGPVDANATASNWVRPPSPVTPDEQQAPMPTLQPNGAGPVLPGNSQIIGPVPNGGYNIASPPMAGYGPGCGPACGCPTSSCNPCCSPCNPCCTPCQEMCGMPSCCGSGACDHGTRFYVSADYLLWFLKASPTPVLVTTGNPADGNFAGALDRSGTVPLFGGEGGIGTAVRSGGRVNFGYWFTDDHCIGLDFGGFVLGDRSDNFTASSRGDMILARPFFDTVEQNAEQVSNLGQGIAGSVTVGDRTSFWGGEANLRSNLWCGCCMKIDVLAGFRVLGLDENLNIGESLVVLGNTPATAPFAGTRIDVADMFKTTNRFYGGQIGTVAEFRKGNWTLDMTAKLGIGNTSEQVQISGITSTTPVVGGVTGATVTGPGGLLTGATTNMGIHNHEAFSVVPELGLNIGYQVTDHIRLYAGYNFLYWSDVARPGEQIDSTVNPLRVFGSTAAAGPANPAYVQKSSDFWAQGVNVGIQFKY